MLKMFIVFAALVGFAFTVNTPTPANAARICVKDKYTGTGRGPLKSVAEAAARAKWRVGIARRGLFGYSLWSKSKNKSMSCSKKSYGYKCKAQAIPCKPRLSNPTKKGFFEVRNLLGRCLDVAGGVNANGTNVQIFDCNGSKSQQWTYRRNSKTLHSKMAWRCLDVASSVNVNRTNVQINDCNGSKSQQWIRNSRQEFRNAMGRCLEVAGGVNANRTNVQIFDCNRTKSQQWRH